MSTMAMEVTGTPGACHSNTAWTEPTEQAKGLLPQEKGDTIWGLGGPSPSLRDTRLLCGLGTPPGGHRATFPSGSHFPPQAASQSCPEEKGWASLRLLHHLFVILLPLTAGHSSYLRATMLRLAAPSGTFQAWVQVWLVRSSQPQLRAGHHPVRKNPLPSPKVSHLA